MPLLPLADTFQTDKHYTRVDHQTKRGFLVNTEHTPTSVLRGIVTQADTTDMNLSQAWLCNFQVYIQDKQFLD